MHIIFIKIIITEIVVVKNTLIENCEKRKKRDVTGG